MYEGRHKFLTSQFRKTIVLALLITIIILNLGVFQGCEQNLKMGSSGLLTNWLCKAPPSDTSC